MQLLSFYFRTFLTLTLLLVNCQLSHAADDIVLADFENKTSVPLRDGQQKLHIFTDRTVFEIFAADGLVYVPFPVIPKAENQSVKVSAASGSVEFANLVVHELNSIWQTKSK